MPELPEVETTRRGIERALKSRRVEALRIYDRRLRWPIEADLPEEVAGQRVLAIGRRAKYLLIMLERGALIVHLGMSGSLRLRDAVAPLLKHDHYALHINSGKELRFHDPRRSFGLSLHSCPRSNDQVRCRRSNNERGCAPLTPKPSRHCAWVARRPRNASCARFRLRRRAM